jgi:hypothetical protein
MTHARSQIRNAVTAILLGNTSAQNRVYESRIYPLDNAKLPALLVYTKQENVADYSISYPRTQNRQLQLTIEAYVKASNNSDEVADQIALEVEQLIAANPKLGGLAKDTILATTEIQFSDDGEKPIAYAIMNFTVSYTVKENAPQTTI